MRCSSRYLVILLLLLCNNVSSLVSNGCYDSIISFGDSIADTGNLKILASRSGRVIPFFLPPYGQSLPDKSTGRCSDGLLIIDFLAKSLGLPLVPPYLGDTQTDNAVEFRQGVNYAVAGATALSSSALAARGIINPATNASLEVQLEWFKQSLPSICGNFSDCRKFIRSSLILLGEIGGNDFNYPILLQGKKVEELESLIPPVTDTIIAAVNMSIAMGAQTLVVPGNFPIGCIPSFLTVYNSENEVYDPKTGCLSRLNEFAQHFNAVLLTKLIRVQKLHPLVNIIYADYYNAALQLYISPNKFGFTNDTLKACCGGGGLYNFNASAPCGLPSATVCDQPNTFISWDGIHFTEAAHKIISTSLYNGPYTLPRFDLLCLTST